MSDEDSSQEKTHEPTEQKKQQFREDGKVAKSQEITGVVGLVVGFGVLLSYAPSMSGTLQDLARKTWSVTPEQNMLEVMGWAATALVGVLSVPLAAMWVGAAVIGLIQSRGIIPKEPLKLDWERVNPISQFQQKFMTPTPIVELVKGVLKIVLLGGVVWSGVQPRLGLLVSLVHEEPTVLLSVMRSMVWVVLLRTVPVAIGIAVLDYSYQWWRLKQKMMMSREDMKQEAKNSEGDPHQKAARRRRQMEISRSVQAVAAVAEADVIIVNPTHYTIALRYRREESPAPMVLAKGLDHLALKMQAEARRHDIPRIENRPLAHALYAQAKVGQMIPEDLYAAVAEILAIIYRRKRARQG